MKNMTSAADTIWKYMDLGKFAYLLETGCLYFASPAQFEDDLEGRVPKSHEEAFEALVHDSFIAPIAALRPHFAAAPDSLAAFDAQLAKAGDALPEARRKAPLRFVVSCWHQSPSESEWMWEEYAGHGTGIAIESTIEGLEGLCRASKAW